MSDEGPTGAPLDVPTLELLGRRATTHPLVVDWSFRPDSLSPRTLVIDLDGEQYPDAVTAARFDICWYEDGDYTVHYVESRPDEAWQCRWDRHPKPGAPRAHVHPPPDASDRGEPSDVEGEHPLDVLFFVLDWLDARVERLYET